MAEIKYYPVIDMDTEGNEKHAMLPTTDENTVREHHRLWLEEIVPRYFRLCSAMQINPASLLKCSIHCPRCGRALKPISSLTTERRCFLYFCEKCTSRKGE